MNADKVAPLLYHIIRGQDIVPRPVEVALQVAYLQSFGNQLLRRRDLGCVLRHLSAAGVPVILLKGAALVGDVYDDIAVRPMTDLDLLVRRTDAPAAATMCAQIGYGPVHTETQAGATLAFENEWVFCRPGQTHAKIEIHWSLIDSPYYQDRLPMTWFWQSAVPVNVDGAEALALGREALMIHLCAHLALHHGGTGILWLHDVAEVLHAHGHDLDWSQLLARAQAWDLVLPLQTVVRRVAQMWHVPLPDAVLRRMAALRPSPAEVRIFAWHSSSHRPTKQRLWIDLKGMTNMRARVHFAWINLFPSPAYMRQRYHIQQAWRLPFWYVARILTRQ